jgi:hypothetical protein
MIKMMTRGGLDFDEENQIWDRTPPEAAEPLQSTSVIQAGERNDTSKGDGGKGKRENKKRKKRNRNRGKTESQPSSTLVLSDEPAEPTKESILSLSGVKIVATVSPDPLEKTLSLLSQQSIDTLGGTGEDRGALTSSKIVNIVDIQALDKHHTKEDQASTRQQEPSEAAIEGAPESIQYRGKKSGVSRIVRADIDALP